MGAGGGWVERRRAAGGKLWRVGEAGGAWNKDSSGVRGSWRGARVAAGPLACECERGSLPGAGEESGFMIDRSRSSVFGF
jgi:hypothetical protein